MSGLHVDAPTLSVPEQKINYGVTFPRDPAAVVADREWADARLARSNGYRPRLTEAEALAMSQELSAEIRARKEA